MKTKSNNKTISKSSISIVIIIHNFRPIQSAKLTRCLIWQHRFDCYLANCALSFSKESRVTGNVLNTLLLTTFVTFWFEDLSIQNSWNLIQLLEMRCIAHSQNQVIFNFSTKLSCGSVQRVFAIAWITSCIVALTNNRTQPSNLQLLWIVN